MVPVTDRATHGAVPVDVYRVSGTHVKEKKDLAILEDFFSFSFFSFPSTVTRAFPWPTKRKEGRPIRGIGTHSIDLD